MKKVAISWGACAVVLTGGAALAQDLPRCDRYPLGQESYACECPAGAPQGSIWGTGVYTSDSDICTAALHAGVIGTSGGAILALEQSGQESYPASTANGVESRAWGAYGSSFIFEAKGPRAVVSGTAPACGRFDPSVGTLTCHCPSAPSTGAVWGSGPYTADSDICAAALHAGVLDGMERDVTVLALPGLDRYTGTIRNGVTTRDWGAYGDSFIINANE